MKTPKYISNSIKGINKSENQDNTLVIEETNFNIYAIFDGVGSAANSRMGTEIAKSYIEKNYNSYITNNEVSIDKLMFMCNEHFKSVNIRDAFTTYCLAVILKDYSKVYYSSMGDTRIYLISNQYFEQLSEDDSFKFQNVLTKCLGMDYLSFSDFKQNVIDYKDENILLCTDGFYSFLENDKMTFFEIINKKLLKNIEDNFNKVILDKNFDDSTYLLVR